MAEKLCENAPLSIKTITQTLRELQTHYSEPDAMKKADEIGGTVIAGKDAREGMKAFAEKRKAQFRGE